MQVMRQIRRPWAAYFGYRNGVGVVASKYEMHGIVSDRRSDAGGAAAAVMTAGELTPDVQNPLREIRALQAEMDQAVRRLSDEFRANPKLNVLQQAPGYGIAVDVRDLKDRYEVHAFLSDTKAADAKVKLEGDQLKVDLNSNVLETTAGKGGESKLTEWGEYEGMVQLAGTLRADQVKIDRKEHELIITVPKA